MKIDFPDRLPLKSNNDITEKKRIVGPQIDKSMN